MQQSPFQPFMVIVDGLSVGMAVARALLDMYPLTVKHILAKRVNAQHPVGVLLCLGCNHQTIKLDLARFGSCVRIHSAMDGMIAIPLVRGYVDSITHAMVLRRHDFANVTKHAPLRVKTILWARQCFLGTKSQQQALVSSSSPQQQAEEEEDTHLSTEEVDAAVYRTYVFLAQGLWREQLHYEVIIKYQEQQCQGSLDTVAIEQAIEEERSTKWVLAGKDKHKSKQRDTMQYMLTRGSPDRGILAFLWRHPECRPCGIISRAVTLMGFSATFANVMEAGWLSAFESYMGDADMSDEEEHECILGL
jgi:hypothetical protein